MRFRLHAIVICLTAALSAPAVTAHADDKGLDLYYVRHAETVANVTKDYSEENQRTFTAQGREQIAALPEKLAGIEFDAILVSPTWRTQHTIAPYLEETGQVAEIWPELEECCWQADRDAPPVKPRRDREIAVEPAVARLFRFPTREDRFWYDGETYRSSVLLTEAAGRRLQERFGGAGKRVLVVAHFEIGARIMAAMLDDPGTGARPLELGNATVSQVRVEDDGRARLVLLNDEPATPAAAAAED